MLFLKYVKFTVDGSAFQTFITLCQASFSCIRKVAPFWSLQDPPNTWFAGPTQARPPQKWHPDHFIRFGRAQPPKYVVCNALQRAEHLSKLVLPVTARDPHLTHGSLGPHESPPNERHLG